MVETQAAKQAVSECQSQQAQHVQQQGDMEEDLDRLQGETCYVRIACVACDTFGKRA